MRTRCPLVPVLGAAAALFGASSAFAQLPATLVPNSLPPFQGFNRSVHMTVTSPYDDCTMAISTTSSPAGFVTVAPPGPVVGLGPFTFTITSGLKTGSGTLIFLISGDPGNCVSPTQYNIPISITDPGGTPPKGSSHEKQQLEPVSMANGALINTFEDLRLHGPLPIYFERYYYSQLASEGQVRSPLGTNWMHNYDLSLRVSPPSAAVTYYRGESIRFTSSGTTWTQSTSTDLQYQLTQSGTTYQMLDPGSQLVYTFDGASGQLKSIADRRGNTQTLTYTNSLLSHIADGLGGTLDFVYTGTNLSKVTDQSGRSLFFTYSGGTISSFTDVGGKVTRYAYTGNGLMTSASLPRANVPYTTAYDASGLVTTQTDAAGNTFKFSFNTTAGTSTMTDPLSQLYSYTHSNRDLTQETDPAGNITQSTYDGSDRLLSRRDAAGHTTTFTYDATTGLVATTAFPDGSFQGYTLTSFAANGFTYYDITSVAYPDGSTESFQYDARGNILSRTDRNGQIWKTIYESHGLPLVKSAPNGSTTTYTYSTDGLANLVSIQFPGTSVINYKVDSLRRITSRQNSDGTSIAYTYDPYDHILTSTDEAGSVATYAYDANGNLASIKDPDGGVTQFTRTGTDKIGSVTDGVGRTLTAAYDSLDRPSKISYADGSGTQFGYDAAGNQNSFTDGEGKVWKQGFNPAGVMNSFTEPLGGKTSLTLDVMDRVTQLATPAARNTTYAYDKMGRVTTITDPLQKATTYTYDKAGNLTGATAPGALTATYGRDGMGFLSSITDPGGNKWGFTYDGFGRQLSVTDPLNQTQTFTRDARGRISSVTLPLGYYAAMLDGTGRVTNTKYSDGTSVDTKWDAAGHLTSATGLTFGYDNSGALTSSNGISITRDKVNRVSQVTLAAGKTVTYTYDRRGLITQVTDWLNGNTTFQYDDNSRLISVTRPNGVTSTYGYDADGLLTSIQDAKSASLSSISLTRDQRGLVSQATRTLPLNPTSAQLASVQSFHTFDAAGQIKEFQYDAMGRRTSDDTRTYVWDLASRLTSYAGGTDSGTLTSNGLGLIASQTKGGVTQQYVWNFGLGLPSISSIQTATDSTYYVHTPSGQLLYSVDSTGARHFYHYDEMGNTIFLTDDTGAVTDKYAYTEYGALLAPSGGSSNPFLFGGRDGTMALGAGLYSMRARVYDSRTGVFLSRDERIHLAPEQINAYAYAANNPLQFNDVSGADPNPGSGPIIVYIYVPIPGATVGGPGTSAPLIPGTGFTGLPDPPITLYPLPSTLAGTQPGQVLGNATSYINPIQVPQTVSDQQAEIHYLYDLAKKANQSNGFNAPRPAPAGGGAGNGQSYQPGNGQSTAQNGGSGNGLAGNRYQDVVNRINALYKRGKITAAQRNKMLLWAKVAADQDNN
jgi:RHS repeat-associated protein